MYIRKLQVQRLKRLAELKLDFTHEGRARMWTVLIGENGTAKTSILQAIALAATGSKLVNTLAGSKVVHLRDRRGGDPLKVDATFDFTPLSQRKALRGELHPLAGDCDISLGLRSTVKLEAGSTTLDGTARYVGAGAKRGDPLDAARAANTPLWFVAGYGILRALPDANAGELARPSIERMQPLFRDTPLQSTAFSDHFRRRDKERSLKAGTTSRQFAKELNRAIKVGGDGLLPDITKLELRGQGGAQTNSELVESDRFLQRMGRTSTKMAGVALSHGYQSTFAWVADLIGHVLLEANEAERGVAIEDMEGLVLLDEIDLYLHPAWQASFVAALRAIFPNFQFVVTTHSPVILASVAPHEVVRLGVEASSGDVVRVGWDRATGDLQPVGAAEPLQPDPRLMTGGELYRSWFGLDRLTVNPHGADLRR